MAMNVEKAFVRFGGAVEVFSILQLHGFSAAESKKMEFLKLSFGAVVLSGGGRRKSRNLMGAGNQSLNQQPNNSLKRTEALARWLRRAQAASPRINVQWTRGQAALVCVRSAAA